MTKQAPTSAEAMADYWEDVAPLIRAAVVQTLELQPAGLSARELAQLPFALAVFDSHLDPDAPRPPAAWEAYVGFDEVAAAHALADAADDKLAAKLHDLREFYVNQGDDQ